MLNLIPILLIIAGGLIVTVGDVFIQKWVDGQPISYYIIGLIIYTVAGALLAYSFKYKSIVIASVLYILVNIITLLFVNAYYFNQSLTPMQYIGVFFGIMCIVFLELSSI